MLETMEDITLQEVIDLLKEVEEDVDYENITTLVDDRYLTSLDILAVISAIDDEFDVAIPAKDIVPENFNSAASIHALIVRLAEDE